MSTIEDENMNSSKENAELNTTDNVSQLSAVMSKEEEDALDGLEREIAQIHNCEPETALPLPACVERVEHTSDLEAELSANNDEHVLLEMQPPQQHIEEIDEISTEQMEKVNNNNADVQGVTIEGEGEYQILEIDDDIEEQQPTLIAENAANKTITNNNNNNNNNNKTTGVTKLTREEERAMAMEQMACLNAVVDRRRRRSDKNMIAKINPTNAVVAPTAAATATTSTTTTTAATSSNKKLESAAKTEKILINKLDGDWNEHENDNNKTKTKKNLIDEQSKKPIEQIVQPMQKITTAKTTASNETADVLANETETSNATAGSSGTSAAITSGGGFKRTRIIKRKIIWDPDAPETQFSFTKFARDNNTAKLGNNNNDNSKKTVDATPKNVAKMLKKKKSKSKEPSSSPSPSTSAAAAATTTATKKKKPSEVERLLGDEGAANMVNDVQDKQKKCISQRSGSKRAASSSRDNAMYNLNNSINNQTPATRRTLIRKVNSVYVPTGPVHIVHTYPSNTWQHVYNDQNERSVIVRRRSLSSHSSLGSASHSNQNSGRINSAPRNTNNQANCTITTPNDSYTDNYNNDINDDDDDVINNIRVVNNNNNLTLRRPTVSGFGRPNSTIGSGNRNVAAVTATYADSLNSGYKTDEYQDAIAAASINSGYHDTINASNMNARRRQTINPDNHVTISDGAAPTGTVGYRVTPRVAPTATITNAAMAQQPYEINVEPSTSTGIKPNMQQRTRASVPRQRTTGLQFVLPPHTRLTNLPTNVTRKRQNEATASNNIPKQMRTRVVQPKLRRSQDGATRRSTDSHMINLDALDTVTDDSDVKENKRKKRKLKIGSPSSAAVSQNDHHILLRNTRRMNELREGIRRLRLENRNIRARNQNSTTAINDEDDVVDENAGLKFDEQWYSLEINFWTKVYSSAADKEAVGVNVCEIWQRHYHHIFCLYFKYGINKKTHGRNYTVDAAFIQTLAQEIQKCVDDDDCKVIILGTLSNNFMRGIDFQSGLTTGHPNKRRERAEEFGAALKLLFSAIALCPKPIIVGVKGVVRGFAVTMLPLFDAVICARSTQFVTPYHKIGQLPEGFCFWKNENGPNNMLTKNLFQLGQSILADNAYYLGLVNKVVEAEDVHAETGYLAAEMLTVRAETYRQIKEPTLKAYKHIIDTCWDDEMQQIINEWCSPECLNNFGVIGKSGYQNNYSLTKAIN